MPILIDQAGTRYEFTQAQQLSECVELDGGRLIAGQFADFTFEGFEPPMPPQQLTKRAFQNRFPKLEDGVSTKYDAMSMFLNKDAYAASLVPDDTLRTALQLLVTTGLNRFDAAGYVDLAVSDAGDFTGLLMQSVFPEAFRLTADERAAILATPIEDSERYGA